MKHVLVVGGGYAGVAAATALAERGVRVTLLESRGSLGGRVYSTGPSERFPAPADNGPHLFMGCYHETLALFDRLRVRDAFHWIDPLGLCWLVKGETKLSLRCSRLPAPLHLASGLLFSDAFPFGEKVHMARALTRFSKRPFRVPEGALTVAQFLDATGQGQVARERFWGPLTNAVMNVPIEQAPLAGFGEVLHRVFFGTRHDSAFAVAAQPLSKVAFPSVEAYLGERGGALRTGEGARSFKAAEGSIEVEGRSGERYDADALVLAVPPPALAGLWPQGTWERAEHFPGMGKSPILSVHAILDRPVFNEHFLGLSGARFEFVFNRNANWGWKGEGQYLSFTASAADDLANRKDPELVELAMTELRERLPGGTAPRVLHSKVTREMAATFAWTLESNSWRPPCATPFPNVFLAGDWTDTGLPATIEGACLSGHRAADGAIKLLEGES